jgi:uncharacterized protein (DUF2132 family)
MTADQPNNPLHGVTLQVIVETLVERHGWDGLAERIPVRCFTHEPSVTSSLKFLRKTPWARAKVEALYLDVSRNRKRNQRRAARRATRAELEAGVQPPEVEPSDA